MDELEQQVRVSKMLGMAFVLSITGFFGVGSLIALIPAGRRRESFELQREESAEV